VPAPQPPALLCRFAADLAQLLAREASDLLHEAGLRRGCAAGDHERNGHKGRAPAGCAARRRRQHGRLHGEWCRAVRRQGRAQRAGDERLQQVGRARRQELVREVVA
jgi:hypothetical protein